MHRTQIYLTDELHHALARLSKQTGVSRSHLIRTALERAYLSEHAAPSHARAPRAAYGADDVPTAEVTAASAGGGSFDFWDAEDEDVYLPTDGSPIE